MVASVSSNIVSNMSITSKTLKAKILKLENSFGQFLFCPNTYNIGQVVEITQYYCGNTKRVWWQHALMNSAKYAGWSRSEGPTTIADKAILDEYFKVVD